MIEKQSETKNIIENITKIIDNRYSNIEKLMKGRVLHEKVTEPEPFRQREEENLHFFEKENKIEKDEQL